jgi:hypothetical protein
MLTVTRSKRRQEATLFSIIGWLKNISLIIKPVLDTSNQSYTLCVSLRTSKVAHGMVKTQV